MHAATPANKGKAAGQDGTSARPRLVDRKVDPLIRRQRFEAAYPQVTILPPATLNSRWLAVVPPCSVPGDPTATTLSGWQLEDLMDRLEQIWPLQDGLA